jgi:hypothetical protein
VILLELVEYDVRQSEGVPHSMLYKYNNIFEEFNMLKFRNFFKKKNVSPEPSTFPSSSQTSNDWMSKKVEHYAKHKPKNLHTLFSPASGDYLPLSVHVGSSWKKEHQDHYRELKKQHPEAVKKAKEMTRGLAGQLSKSKVGDYEDF